MTNSTVTQIPIEDRLKLGAAEHGNQAKLAYEFALEHRGKLLHVANMGWFSYDGRRWANDTGLTHRALLQTLRTLRIRADNLIGKGKADGNEVLEQQGKSLRRTVRACESAGGLAGVLKIAAHLEGMTATVDELDADAMLLNMPNGTLDMTTMQVRPHDPADRITKITRGSFEPSAQASPTRWGSFLDQVLPDKDVQCFFQRLMGLSLLGEVREHIFSIATGEGRNGKGVAYGAMMHALGDYAAVAEDGLFEVQRGGNAQAATPGLAKLRGVRFLVASELEEKARISAAFMKRMTGGDLITARELYGAPFQFTPAFLILMITNFLPKLPANDPATWARVRVIPFDVVIAKDKQDPELPSKLKVEQDAVLAWAVEGLADYLANGLSAPASVLAATQAYAESQDDARRFIEARCDVLGSGGDTTTQLFSAYLAWASEEGIGQGHILGRSGFGRALDKLGFPSTRTNKGAVRKCLVVDHSKS